VVVSPTVIVEDEGETEIDALLCAYTFASFLLNPGNTKIMIIRNNVVNTLNFFDVFIIPFRTCKDFISCLLQLVGADFTPTSHLNQIYGTQLTYAVAELRP
jgi:hypothetical protein